MNYVDFLTGRIIQRIVEAKRESDSKIVIKHGVNNSYDIDRLIKNLFEFFPDSSISLKKLKYGYELKIEIN